MPLFGIAAVLFIILITLLYSLEKEINDLDNLIETREKKDVQASPIHEKNLKQQQVMILSLIMLFVFNGEDYISNGN